MEGLFEVLSRLKATFSNDPDVITLIEHQERDANKWVDENDYERQERLPRSFGATEMTDGLHGSRSIFDDVDV
ncbi:hypothetical protein D3C72_2509080 [compost metagenome]